MEFFRYIALEIKPMVQMDRRLRLAGDERPPLLRFWLFPEIGHQIDDVLPEFE